MSANVFGFAERQGEGRVRAWHNLGYTQNSPMTAQEAITYAGIDYRVGKFPLSTLIPISRDGKTEEIPLPDQVSLVREKTSQDPNFRIFGTVSPSYQVIQNRDIAKIIDSLPVNSSNPISVETAGALGYGETVFFALRLGEFQIKGDSSPIEEYFFVTEEKTGKGGLQMGYTPVRIVCANTLALGLSKASFKISLTHSQTLRADTEALAQVYASMQVKNQKGREALQSLSSVSLSIDSAKSLITSVYPDPKPSQLLQLSIDSGGAFQTLSTEKEKDTLEKEMENVQIFRAKTEDLYEIFNDQFPQIAATGYALYNAITEHEDHIRKGALGVNRAEASLFGNRAVIKSKAFDLISSLA